MESYWKLSGSFTNLLSSFGKKTDLLQNNNKKILQNGPTTGTDVASHARGKVGR
jgi:hypothetical protein